MKKKYSKPEIQTHGNLKELTLGKPPLSYDDALGDS